jgi:hypothetical protein
LNNIRHDPYEGKKINSNLINKLILLGLELGAHFLVSISYTVKKVDEL